MRKQLDPAQLALLLDDVERVLGNLILEYDVEGEQRDVWHQFQTYLGMPSDGDFESDDSSEG